MAYKIFISYASEDADIARDLAQRLREVEAEVTLPKPDLTRDTTIGSESELKSLRDCDEIIFLLTDEAVKGYRASFEAGVASSLRKRVTPVLIGLPQAPEVFQHFSSIRYSELAHYIAGLRKRISAKSRVIPPPLRSRKMRDTRITKAKDTRAATGG